MNLRKIKEILIIGFQDTQKHTFYRKIKVFEVYFKSILCGKNCHTRAYVWWMLEIEGVFSFIPQLLDYEACNSYTFSVEVSNPIVDPRYLKKGPFKDQATVRVMVLNADEPPQFSQVRYHLDVSENCPPVCSVGRVYAVDPDTGQSSNIR